MGARRRKAMTARRRLLNEYHTWDARKINQLIPGQRVIDVTITSPPYWNLKDYGTESQIGFGQTYDRYLADLTEIFRAVHSLTKQRGSIWIVSDTIKRKGEIKLLPFDLAGRLSRIGWILQDIIIWHKDRTLPWSHQGKLRNIFEYILFFSKTRQFNYHLSQVRAISGLREWWVRYPERYSPEGKAPARVWWIPIPRQGSWVGSWVRHFNPLPQELVERILLLTSEEGDVVLDPFSGSGAVLAEAHVMGRKYIGLDLNPDYRKMFMRQVLPAFRRIHKQRTHGTREVKVKRLAFGKLIRALRCVKFPKELVRLYRREHGNLPLTAVLALRGTEHSRLDVIFVFPRKSKIPRGFLPRVAELASRPPLSKYGIRPSFTARSARGASLKRFKGMGVRPKQTLYLYLDGRTYTWAERMTAPQWFDRNRDNRLLNPNRERYPPILSNIGVKANRAFLSEATDHEDRSRIRSE